MRQIVLDTETTGLDPAHGHRIIEIGCVELENRRLTGKHYHCYLNPDREIDEGAFGVHGLSNEFLADKRRFADVIDEFLAFITDSELVIHNAPFDVGFLNSELALSNDHRRIEDVSTVTDSLLMARKKHPGQRNSLDALCKRYDVDNSQRELHGALLDAEILADVYLAMTGGQTHLLLAEEESFASATSSPRVIDRDRPALRVISPTADELALHQQRLQAINKASGEACIWLKQVPDEATA